MNSVRCQILLGTIFTEKHVASSIDFKPKLAALQNLNFIRKRVILPFIGHPITKIYTGLYII